MTETAKLHRNIRNCSVAVVGGAGFLGSHLVNHLVDDRNCAVSVVDNLVVGNREWVHPKAKFFHHDITLSEDHLRAIFLADKVDYVFNYCANPYIPNSFVRPLHVFTVNATGAIKVINAAQEAGCKGILQVSSAEIYGGGTHPDDWPQYVGVNRKIDEDCPIEPHSTYGAAKAAVDYYCQAAWRERQTPVIALRQFNCLGERESHPYVVPEVIMQLDNYLDRDPLNFDRPLPLRDGTGAMIVPEVRLGNNSTRDFIYAGDAVRIAVELLERGAWGEVYNLGSETSIKMYDLAKLIGKLMGFESVNVVEDEARKRPWEIWHLCASNEKLYDAIGHDVKQTVYESETVIQKTRPMVSLAEALKRTIAWYNENGRKWPWE